MSTKCAHNISEKNRSEDILINEKLDFTSLLLSEKTISGLTKSGFEKPSPIQVKAIPIGKCGFDLIVKSKSGTGKTAVFGIIALEMLNPTKNDIQVLILAPTREIAAQICDVIKSIGADFEGLNTEYFIGGLPIEDDIKKLKGCQIAVGAPGRIRHLIEAGHMKWDSIKLFVLDEADKLMESNFQSDINKIFLKLPPRKQIIALSATYPDQLDQFLTKYMQSPSHISPNTDSPLLLGLKHFVSTVKTHLNIIKQLSIKSDELIRLLSKISYTQCLIFTNFQTRAESISNSLNRKGWASTYISAAQSQNERLEAIRSLKDMNCRILLSTDLTARGIDASNVDLVINYDVPVDASTYLHRMGRAGRYGSKGICITIAATGKEILQFQNIIGMIGGNTMAVGKLPCDDTFPDDLWEVAPESFDQVYGIVDETCQDEKSLRIKNIKGALFDLKNNENKVNKKEVIEKDVPEDELKESTSENDNETRNILLQLASGDSEDNIKKMLNKRKHSKKEVAHKDNKKVVEKTVGQEVEDHSQFENDNETRNILMQLANGESDVNITNMMNKRKNSRKDVVSDTQALLLKLANGEKADVEIGPKCTVDLNKISEDMGFLLRKGPAKEEFEEKMNTNDLLNKLVNCESITEVESFKRKRTEGSRYDKNVSLLNVAKCLYTTDFYGDNQADVSTVQSYITDMKTTEVPQEKVDFEDIFIFAYDFNTKSNQKHWLDVIGEEFDENQLPSKPEVINLLDCIEVDEEYDDYDYEEEEEQEMEEGYELERYEENANKKAKNEICQPTGASWDYAVGVNSQHEYSENEKFVSHYNHCSDTLYNNFGKFRSADEFHSCYSQWQQQVAGVRDYVQQNIYVQEMNNFQYCKYNT